MLIKKTLAYQHSDTKLQGFLAYEEGSANRPLILVAHDWSGCNDFAKTKAEQLAELGYVGFAIDMFGEGKIGKTNEEKMALIQPLINDRNLLRQRINAAFETSKKFNMIDPGKTAAIGFCFGGLCVLDLARSGADVRGVVSFHGLLMPSPIKNISAKILALHGHDDPMVPPDAVMAFESEMTAAKADWQIHVYGNTKHAFTNPSAHDEALGTVYQKTADKRSWLAMQNFLTEIFY